MAQDPAVVLLRDFDHSPSYDWSRCEHENMLVEFHNVHIRELDRSSNTRGIRNHTQTRSKKVSVLIDGVAYGCQVLAGC